jgi:hypothetical protein
VISGCPDPVAQPVTITIVEPPAPTPPADVTVAEVSGGFSHVRWQPTSPNPWYYSVVTTRNGLLVGWINVPGDVTSTSILRPHDPTLAVQISTVNRWAASEFTPPVPLVVSGVGPAPRPASPPGNLTASQFVSGSATARWTPPAHDGGSPIVGYGIAAVPRSAGTPGSWQTVGADVRVAPVEVQAPGTYDIHVFAITGRGLGESASTPVVLGAPGWGPTPFSPLDISLRHTPSGTVVAWRPAEGAGAPVLAYSVVATQAGRVVAWRNTDALGRHAVLSELLLPLPATTISVFAYSRRGAGSAAVVTTGG